MSIFAQLKMFFHVFFLQLNIFPQILYCFSKVPTNIIEIYQKINFSEKTKKLNSEVYDMQTDILTKLYTEKKTRNIFNMKRFNAPYNINREI